MKLFNILSEIESEQISAEIGNELDNIFKDELNKASQQQNEAVLTTLALTLAIPGFLKGVAKIAEIISKKKGINLKKKNNKSWYKILEEFAEKIDTYVETPFNIILKPIVSDDAKRKKIVSFIKGACIVAMAIIGSVDLNQSPNALAKIKSTASEFSSELLQNAGTNNLPKFIEYAKKTIENIIK